MTNDLDRVITHVASALTRADATGLGARVRARLDGDSTAVRQPARLTWLWPAVTVGAVVIVSIVVMSRSPARAPLAPAIATTAAATATTTVSAPPIDTASHSTARPAPRATARAARPAPPAVSPAELAWRARALPPLPEATPVFVSDVAMAPIGPRDLELPVIVVEPLGARDPNK
jgi:hypothetical protein